MWPTLQTLGGVGLNGCSSFIAWRGGLESSPPALCEGAKFYIGTSKRCLPLTPHVTPLVLRETVNFPILAESIKIPHCFTVAFTETMSKYGFYHYIRNSSLKVSQVSSCWVYMASAIQTRDCAVQAIGSRPQMLVRGKAGPQRDRFVWCFLQLCLSKWGSQAIVRKLPFFKKSFFPSQDTNCPEMPCVLEKVPLLWQTPGSKATLGKKRIHFFLWLTVHNKGKSRQAHRQGRNWSRDGEGTLLVACFPRLTKLALYNPGLPAQVGPTHSGLDLSH